MKKAKKNVSFESYILPTKSAPFLPIESDPAIPFWEGKNKIGRGRIPTVDSWKYRVAIPDIVKMWKCDEENDLRISENGLSVVGSKGYSVVYATHYVNRGRWYYEAIITSMPGDSASRIGWCQKFIDYRKCVGADKFGYAWRSKKGTVFHGGHGKHYSEGYGEKCVLGFLIDLPENPNADYLPKSYKDTHLVLYKKKAHFVDADFVAKNDESIKNVLKGSKIEFFKNGLSQGVAYEDIYEGSYYPAVSLYKNASVTLNFGPFFSYPQVPQYYSAKPMYERPSELQHEYELANSLDLAESDLKTEVDFDNIFPEPFTWKQDIYLKENPLHVENLETCYNRVLEFYE